MATTFITPVSRDMAAATNELLYTVPTSKRAVVDVNVAARDKSGLVRIAIGSGASPGNGDYVVYDVPLGKGMAPIRLEKVPLTAGMKVWVRASIAGYSGTLTGIVEDA